MVARGAGATGPVVLACCQWDPLGLARRLPNRCLCAPLLPWWVQCPVGECATVAGGQGRQGRCRFSLPPPLLPPFLALLAERVAGCPVRVSLAHAWGHAIPRGLCVPRARSGCPSGVRRLSVVCLCACAPAVCALLPIFGAGRAVPGGPWPSVFPALVLCSACLVCVGPVRSARLPAWIWVLRLDNCGYWVDAKSTKYRSPWPKLKVLTGAPLWQTPDKGAATKPQTLSVRKKIQSKAEGPASALVVQMQLSTGGVINVSKLDKHGTKYSVTACHVGDIEETPPARFQDLQYPLWVGNADLFVEYDSAGCIVPKVVAGCNDVGLGSDFLWRYWCGEPYWSGRTRALACWEAQGHKYNAFLSRPVAGILSDVGLRLHHYV